MKPVSAVPFHVSVSGAIGAGCIWLLICLLHPPILLAQILFLAGCALPMWALEMRRFKSLDSWSRKLILPAWRRQLRLYGLAILSSLFLVTISVFLMFSAGVLSGFSDQLNLLLICSILWMMWIAARHPSSRQLDSVEALGRAAVHLIKNCKKFDRNDRQLFLAWLVKAVFLPMMFSSSLIFLDMAATKLSEGHGWWRLFNTAYFSLFAIDTAFATVGYCSTSRRIDGHIRSTEPTLLGWGAALVCYPPLNQLVLHRWLSYGDGYEWHDWLAGQPLLLFFWGAAILLMVGLYVSATIAFGPRFSNLTNRGIITSGPYRYFKHPSYIGKNIAWWLISIPFISNDGLLAALTHCCALLTINGIYMLRAKTEERHLMSDSDYQIYSAWIARHGVFARVRRLLLVDRAAARVVGG